MCRFYGFIGGLTGTASIATLTAISIDRYNVGKKINENRKFELLLTKILMSFNLSRFSSGSSTFDDSPQILHYGNLCVVL